MFIKDKISRYRHYLPNKTVPTIMTVYLHLIKR